MNEIFLYHIFDYPHSWLLLFTDRRILIYESLILTICSYYLGITGSLLIEGTEFLYLHEFREWLTVLSDDEIGTISNIEYILCRSISFEVSIRERYCREISFFIVCLCDICQRDCTRWRYCRSSWWGRVWDRWCHAWSRRSARYSGWGLHYSSIVGICYKYSSHSTKWIGPSTSHISKSRRTIFKNTNQFSLIFRLFELVEYLDIIDSYHPASYDNISKYMIQGTRLDKLISSEMRTWRKFICRFYCCPVLINTWDESCSIFPIFCRDLSKCGSTYWSSLHRNNWNNSASRNRWRNIYYRSSSRHGNSTSRKICEWNTDTCFCHFESQYSIFSLKLLDTSVILSNEQAQFRESLLWIHKCHLSRYSIWNKKNKKKWQKRWESHNWEK